jgi:uncharacterized protein YndB with AHSA1/START domain
VSQPEPAALEGPVSGTAEIEVAAPVETVWRVLTDLEQWPNWNSDVTSMTVDGPLAEGTVFRWKAGPRTIVSTIERVDRPRIVVWSGKTLGVKATHAWHFEQVGEATHVRTEEALRGIVARVLRRSLQKTLDSALESGLRNLKAEAERISLGTSS